MNEVFAKNNGSFEFDSVESDYNVYTYENDEDVIKKLATKAGGEYELLTRTMIMHPSMGISFNPRTHVGCDLIWI